MDGPQQLDLDALIQLTRELLLRVERLERSLGTEAGTEAPRQQPAPDQKVA